MASSKEYLDYILDQLSELDDISYLRYRLEICLVRRRSTQNSQMQL
jgi:hypothetical protein